MKTATDEPTPETATNTPAPAVKTSAQVKAVIARHDDPMFWLSVIPEDYEIYISSSGTTPEIPKKSKHKIKIVDGIGEVSEAGHWVKYIVDNYDTLADVNIFLKGSPHLSAVPNILFQLERKDIAEPFAYLTSSNLQETTVDGKARTLIQSAVGRGHTIVPQASGGIWGGQHYATKETIKKYPKQHYVDILSACAIAGFSNEIEMAYNCVYGIPPKA
jgi:hypothetical protein